MENVLFITSSPRGEASYSAQIGEELVGGLGGSVLRRELWRDAPPILSPEIVGALFTPEEARTPEQRERVALSDELLRELKAADTIVIAAGMINFGLPTALKAWIDLVARKGETFRYTEAGPEGLLTGKKLYLVLAYGGVYSSGPMAAMDHLEPQLRSQLGFLGLTDVEVVKIEGVAMGEEATERALAEARERVRELAGTAVLA